MSDAVTGHEIFPRRTHPQTFPQEALSISSYQLMLLCFLDPLQVVFILSFDFGWHYKQQTKQQNKSSVLTRDKVSTITESQNVVGQPHNKLLKNSKDSINEPRKKLFNYVSKHQVESSAVIYSSTCILIGSGNL